MSSVNHPLDPLSVIEIESVANVCKEYDWKTQLKGKFTTASHSDSIILRFNTITLKEPKKVDLISFLQAASTSTNGIKKVPREAFVILQLPPDYLVVEAIVEYSCETSKWQITSWITKKDIQPLATPDDCFDAEAIVKADPTVQELLKRKYGLSNMDYIVADPWSVHGPPTDLKSNRLIQLFMYMRNGLSMDNAYAHPISFTPIVDLNLKCVVRIDEPFLLSSKSDNNKTNMLPPKIPMVNINYHKDLCEIPMRSDLKPLIITQPEGSSWIVNGNEIQWQKWNIRISFNYREGLVLHTVTYNDNGNIRPILHRASLVEMAVPYGDVNEPFTRKCAFDVGDYGLGNCANSLELGCDCLGNIHYFDGVLNNCQGEAVVLKKAICMHEEDHGTLWKHVEYRNRDSQVRRSRRLVLSFVSTVVNYEYAFYWYFYQDGTIQYEIKLTGELSTNALSPDEINKGDSVYGTMVAEGVNAQFHQHLFCVRLDMSCDDKEGGKNCVVSEIDILPLSESDTKNPAGNGFMVSDTPLIKESQAQRIYDVSKQRSWKISNPNSIHTITKKPVSWKLVVPTSSPLLLATPSSLLTKRGKFATKTIWVTPHADDEKWPAGEYTIQSEGGEGLEAWTKADRDCGVGADPVIWLTLAATHIPRVEDFPVMPCETVTFSMKPFNFFGMNPGVDVPPTSVTTTVSQLAGESSCCAATV